MSERLAIAVAIAGVAVTPWLLGGAIPQARLVLLSTSAVAFALLLLLRLSNQGRDFCLTGTALSSLALCVLCVIQLAPIGLGAIPSHAIRSDLIPFSGLTANNLSSHRSVMPAESVGYLSQFLAFTMLNIVLSTLLTTRRRILFVLSVMLLSGVTMGLLALGQRFGATDVLVGNHWKISEAPPFGCFVNPNNAAGWFIIITMMGFLLLCLLFDDGRFSAAAGRRPFGDSVRRLCYRFSQLTAIEITVAISVVLVLTATIATLSRGGILSLAIAVAVFFVSGFRVSNWWVFLTAVVALCALSVILLMALDIDTLVVAELSTLKDPVSESTGRLLHWSDTIATVQDFPWLGLGLGSYRYSTLPYQGHYFGTWFIRADNQFLEILVEGGITGLLVILLTAISVLRISIRCISKFRPERMTTSSCISARAAIAVVLALGAASFFDYGISLPSVGAAILVLTSILQANSRDPGANRSLPLSRATQSVLALFLLIPVVPLFVDLCNASQAYNTTAIAQRFLSQHPAPVSDMQPIVNEIEALLRNSCRLRPDDQEVRRVTSLLMRWRWKLAMLDQLQKQRLLDRMDAEKFSRLSIAELASQLLSAPDSLKTRVRAAWIIANNEVPWVQFCESAKRSSPWIPDISLDLSAYYAITDPNGVRFWTNNLMGFDPSAARELMLAGLICQRLGDQQMSDETWRQSESSSEKFRREILTFALETGDAADVLTKHGPEDYKSVIECAALMEGSVIFAPLLERADALWQQRQPSPSVESASLRATHLSLLGRPDLAVEWLETALQDWPKDVVLRKRRAELLEATGRYSEAYDEWLRIGVFDPDSPTTSQALSRLQKLPDRSR